MSRIHMLLIVLFPVMTACGPTDGDRQPTAGVATRNEQVLNRGANKDEWWHALPRASWQRQRRVETAADQGWFEVYEPMDGVYAIYEPGQFEEVISYLITGEARALLFDTGLGIGDMRGLVTSLTSLPVQVLNSHTHYDHIGGNHQFGAVLATATPYGRERAAGIPRERVAEFVGEGWIWKPTPADFDRASYRIRPFRITETVSDGAIIDLGGRRLEVILTPGHAPDALCLLDRENRLLFTGDTFYPAPLYTHLEGSDFHEYHESAKRLQSLTAEVDHLLPAHNETPVDPVFLDRMAEAFAVVSAGGGEYVETDGDREYVFEGFSLIVDPEAL